MGTITHTKVTGAPADPTAIVDGPAWDAAHNISLTSSDVGLGNVQNVDTTNANNITGGNQTGTGALVRASALTSGKPFFIFATGQSFLTQTPSLSWTPESNVKVWNWDGTDGHIGTAFVAPSSTTINLANKMASDIARANPARSVYLFNIAITGQPISHWLSGTGSPDMLVNIQNNISAALTAAGATQADLGLWAQGQGDCGPINANYVANHATWMGRLWADTTPGAIWFPKETPLIICSIQSVADSNSLNADADNMNVLLNAVANADPDKRRYVYLSSFTGSTYWDLTAHPTAQGHLSIGAMLASEFLRGSGRNTLQGVTVAPATGNITVGNPAYSAVPYLLNYNTSVNPTAPSAGTRHWTIGPNGADAYHCIDSFGGFTAFIGRRANGTQAAPTKVLANNIILDLLGQAYDATGSASSVAAFQLLAAEDANDATHHGTYAQLFLTIPATATIVSYRFDVGGITIPGTTSGSVKVAVPAAAGSNTLTLPAGTTDFSATGGAAQYVKQLSAGGAFTVAAISTNEVTRAMQGQGSARSVIGVAGNATANVADIQGTANQFFGVNSAGTALAFQTMSGDATLSGPAITVTGINGVNQNAAWTSYTPTVTSGAGAFTTVSATGRYKQIGKTVIVQADVTITTAGTAAGLLQISIPLAAAAFNYFGVGKEYASTGKSGVMQIVPSDTKMVGADSAGLTMIASGAKVGVGMTYEVP